MTTECVLSGNGKTVTFTNLNLSITHSFSNPLITLDTPIQLTDKVGSNTIAINIGFVTNDITLSFTLKDGPGTFDFDTPGTTNYEKIIYLAKYTNAKLLTLNGTQFYCHIMNVNIPWNAGLKDISNGSIRLKLTKNIAMA